MENIELIKHTFGSIGTEHFIIITGSLLGSIKASSMINRCKSFFEKSLDIFLGSFCGIMSGHYFNTENNLYISGLVSLLAGIAGAIIIEVIIELLPSATKQVITKYLKNFKEKT